jgi:hypothetical protein
MIKARSPGSLLHKINGADDVRLPGTIRPHEDQGPAAEVKIERTESQNVLHAQRINDQGSATSDRRSVRCSTNPNIAANLTAIVGRFVGPSASDPRSLPPSTTVG